MGSIMGLSGFGLASFVDGRAVSGFVWNFVVRRQRKGGRVGLLQTKVVSGSFGKGRGDAGIGRPRGAIEKSDGTKPNSDTKVS